MVTKEPEVSQLADVELVIEQTNQLTIPDVERAELIGKLKPIADSIPAITKYAEVMVVKSQHDAENAASYLAQIDDAYKSAEATLREFSDPLYKLHRQWTSLINKFKPLTEAKSLLKKKITDWTIAEQEAARQKQAALQAIEEEKARRERERLEKEAAKLKTPEKQAAKLEQAAAVTATVVHVEAPKAAVKFQMRWFVESVDPAAFVQAAATDKSLLGYIKIEEAALARSKAANKMLEVPGVRFVQKAV